MYQKTIWRKLIGCILDAFSFRTILLRDLHKYTILVSQKPVLEWKSKSPANKCIEFCIKIYLARVDCKRPNFRVPRFFTSHALMYATAQNTVWSEDDDVKFPTLDENKSFHSRCYQFYGY